MLSVKASINQCHPKFYGAGKQCVANSYAAMLKSIEKPVTKWKRDDLDDILVAGDQMYNKIMSDGKQEQYLLVQELPDICIDSINCGKLYAESSTYPFLTLEEALKTVKAYAFLTISCYTISIIKTDVFFIFDSHSRNSLGLPDADGCAVLTMQPNEIQLCNFIKKLGKSLCPKVDEVQFELTNVILNAEKSVISDTSSTSSSEFSGFSDISDNEYELVKKNIEAADKATDVTCSYSESNFSDGSDSLCDIPLSVLSQYYKARQLTDSSSEGIPDYDSSGSEYIFTEYEKHKLEHSDSSESDFDENLKKKKLKKRTKPREGYILTKHKQAKFQEKNNLYCLNGNEKAGLNVKSGIRNHVNPVEGDVISGKGGKLASTKEGNMKSRFEFNEGSCEGTNTGSSDEGNVQSSINVTSEVNLQSRMEETGKVWSDEETNVKMGFAGTIGSGVENSTGSSCEGDIGSGKKGYMWSGVEGNEKSNEEEPIASSNMTLDNEVNVRQDTEYNVIGSCRENNIGQSGDNSVTPREEGNIGLIVVANKHLSKGITNKTDCMGMSGPGKSSLNVEHSDSSSNNNDSDYHGDEVNVNDSFTVDCAESDSCRSRKRKRNPEKWQRSIRKRLKNSGKSFISQRGKLIRQRILKEGCGKSCRFKCQEKFTAEERQDIFHSFWSLENIQLQRQFLYIHSSPRPTATKKVSSGSSKNISYMWSFPKEGNQTQRVCKTFFLQTLDISAQMVQTALKKAAAVPGVCSSDKRGKHSNRPNRTPVSDIEYIKSHINLYPRVESHYCRKDTKKEYLEQDLNLTEMYRQYKEQCKKDQRSEVSVSVYRSVFDNNFNIGFIRPLKDACDLCEKYKNASDHEREEMQVLYDNHIANKEASRKQKKHDKMKAVTGNDGTLMVACFDLEKVLMTPKGSASSLYYKRRLNSFNFSMYDLGTSNATCYVWNESICGRGACEIASCVFDFIRTARNAGKKKFIFFSDNCSAQNKNKYYIAMLWYALQKLDIQSIKHKYLQKGHTQSENDSVHAAVEAASSKKPVYTTAQWAATIRAARKSTKPYEAKEIDSSDVYDFRKVAIFLKNFELDTDRQKVSLQNIVKFSLSSDSPNVVCFKYNYNGPSLYLNLVQKVRRSIDIPNPANIELEQLYENGIPIPFEKYRDLLWLCKQKIIPSVHHLFFFMLPHLNE